MLLRTRVPGSILSMESDRISGLFLDTTRSPVLTTGSAARAGAGATKAPASGRTVAAEATAATTAARRFRCEGWTDMTWSSLEHGAPGGRPHGQDSGRSRLQKAERRQAGPRKRSAGPVQALPPIVEAAPTSGAPASCRKVPCHDLQRPGASGPVDRTVPGAVGGRRGLPPALPRPRL